MPSCLPTTERCKALLGTFVRIRVDGLAQGAARAALDRCFEELAQIHRLMSFQEAGSDVSRLNREAHRRTVRVDARTHEVLRHAADMSEKSGGAFDVTVAPWLVRARHNPPPGHAAVADPVARWSDVQLLADRQVRFVRPLWIDVSGIAKGYAVDRAMALLEPLRPRQACVNAGGDLRVAGPVAEPVRLAVEPATGASLPLVALKNGSLASSGAPAGAGAALDGVYIDPVARRTAPARFVSVLAGDCVTADALTKVVMALGEDAQPVLRRFGARALMSAGAAWREVA